MAERDTIEQLERRLASWRDVTGPAWLVDAAPQIIAELEAEIADRRLAEERRCG